MADIALDKSAVTPDYVYDAEDWSETYSWDRLDLLTDNLNTGDILELGTLIQGPTKFACLVHGEVELFDSEEDAAKAMGPLDE